MSCSNITQGISKGCNNNLGGIRNIYISTNPITGYVLSGSGQIRTFSPTPTWLEIEADQGTGNFTETYEINQSGSIISFKQSVTFQINDLSAYNQQRIKELAESTNLGVVVEMNNGKFFTVGIERGAYLETGSTGSGTGYGDLSGSTITITGMEKISSLEVLPSIIQNVRVALWTTSSDGAQPPNQVYWADSLVGPTYTSPESAAVAQSQFDITCDPSTPGLNYVGQSMYVKRGTNLANASSSAPIPIYYSNGLQAAYSIFSRFQWGVWINTPTSIPTATSEFCPVKTTASYQMELADIGSKAYFINAPLLYTL